MAFRRTSFSALKTNVNKVKNSKKVKEEQIMGKKEQIETKRIKALDDELETLSVPQLRQLEQSLLTPQATDSIYTACLNDCIRYMHGGAAVISKEDLRKNPYYEMLKAKLVGEKCDITFFSPRHELAWTEAEILQLLSKVRKEQYIAMALAAYVNDFQHEQIQTYTINSLLDYQEDALFYLRQALLILEAENFSKQKRKKVA